MKKQYILGSLYSIGSTGFIAVIFLLMHYVISSATSTIMTSLYFLSFGLWQWVYTLPPILYFKSKNPSFSKGILYSSFGLLGLNIVIWTIIFIRLIMWAS